MTDLIKMLLELTDSKLQIFPVEHKCIVFGGV